MNYYNNTAVAFDDLKNAALYFDYIVPVSASIDLLPHLARDGDKWRGDLEQIIKCLPSHLLYNPEFLTSLGNLNIAGYYSLAKYLAEKYSFPPRIPGVPEENYEEIERSFAIQYFELIDRFSLRELPIASGDFGGSAWMADDMEVSLSPVVTMSGLRVLDASTASWEQIHELRQDPVAKDRLRRLRLFAFTEYAGKSKAFVEDDILRRISDYDDALRQLGFEAVQGTLNTVLNSKLTASLVGNAIKLSAAPQRVRL